MKTKIAVLLLCAVVLPAQAMDLEAVVGRFGVAVLNNTVANSAPNPVLNTLGVAMVFEFGSELGFYLEPGLDLFWTNYSNLAGRAVPIEYEAGDGNNVFVLGFLLDAPLVYSLAFGPLVDSRQRFRLGLSAGPAFVFRIGFAGDTSPENGSQMAVNLKAVRDYFWQAGRWLYPSVGLRFEALLQDQFTFALGVRGFAAVANSWTGVSPWLDHAMLHISIGMRVALDRRPPPGGGAEMQPSIDQSED